VTPTLLLPISLFSRWLIFARPKVVSIYTHSILKIPKSRLYLTGNCDGWVETVPVSSSTSSQHAASSHGAASPKSAYDDAAEMIKNFVTFDLDDQVCCALFPLRFLL
jgi:hypothetical protein